MRTKKSEKRIPGLCPHNRLRSSCMLCRAELPAAERMHAAGVERPRNAPGGKRGAQLQLRLTDEERDVVHKLAAARQKSASGYVRILVNADAAGCIDWAAFAKKGGRL